jgi:hypothetical protein
MLSDATPGAETMTVTEIRKGSIVTDWRGRRFEVVGLCDVFGIPSADLQRVRKDGVIFGGGREAVTTKRHNFPVSVLELAH